MTLIEFLHTFWISFCNEICHIPHKNYLIMIKSKQLNPGIKPLSIPGFGIEKFISVFGIRIFRKGNTSLVRIIYWKEKGFPIKSSEVIVVMDMNEWFASLVNFVQDCCIVPGVRKRHLFWCCLCPAPLEGRLENENLKLKMYFFLIFDNNIIEINFFWNVRFSFSSRPSKGAGQRQHQNNSPFLTPA